MIDYLNIGKRIENIIMEKKEKSVQKILDIMYQEIPYYNWIGIYIFKNKFLHLGPWAGQYETEHVKIPIGKGICGSAAQSGKIEVIADVQKDERYLSCFLSTKSEIVVPIVFEKNIVGEIDIDSNQKNAFTKQDILFLKKIANMLGPYIHRLT
jgi:GAF domain-containing protein